MTSLRAILGGSRMLIGITAWLAPDFTARFFGIDPARSDRFVTRLFGARELALAGSLLAAPPGALASAAAIGAAIDTVDSIAGFDEYRRGTLSTRGAILGPAGAILFAALGFVIAREATGRQAPAPTE